MIPAEIRHDVADLDAIYAWNKALAALSYGLRHPEDLKRSLVTPEQLIIEALNAHDEQGRALQRIAERHK